MKIELKDITNMDKYIYVTALGLRHPFTTAELLEAIQMQHPCWRIELIRARCKKFRKQKMLRKIGGFHDTKYECLFSIEELQKATIVYSKSIDANKLPVFVCGL